MQKIGDALKKDKSGTFSEREIDSLDASIIGAERTKKVVGAIQTRLKELDKIKYYEAFMDYRVGGTEVSAKGKTIIQKLINGEEVSIENSGLSKREWNELMISFQIDKRIIK